MSSNNQDFIETKTAIVVGTAGHVWVAKTTKQDAAWLHLTNARIIRVWGTDAGLNQLIDGPRRETIIDSPAPIMSLAWHAVIAVIPVNDSAWAKHL